MQQPPPPPPRLERNHSRKNKKVHWDPEIAEKIEKKPNDKLDWADKRSPTPTEIKTMSCVVYGEMIKTTFDNHFYRFNNKTSLA